MAMVLLLSALMAACSDGGGPAELIRVGVLIRPQGGSSPQYDMTLAMPAEMERPELVSALTGLVYVAAGGCAAELRSPVTLVLSLQAGRIHDVVGDESGSCMAERLRGGAREDLGQIESRIVVSLRPHDGSLDALAP